MKKRVSVNVTDEMVRCYVEALHETLRDISPRFFSPTQAKQLLHNSLVPARVICYVSTQFGIAFEYTAAPEMTIETVTGSARVEDLLVKAPRPLRDVGPLFNIGGANIGIMRLTLTDGFPFRLTEEMASVTFREVHFSCDALGWRRDVEYAEVYGDRRAATWSVQAAQGRAKDEILAALFLAQQAEKSQKNLSEYVASFRERHVLVLGAYDPDGEKRLRAISAALEGLGYVPVLVKEIPDIEHYDLAQKVVVIGALSRFIVVDDSTASGHLNELEICRQNRWVMVVMRAHGHRGSWMTAGASISSNVIREANYDPENPRPIIEEAVRWAEECLASRGVKLNEIYPWRLES